jgi:hypothetical protein
MASIASIPLAVAAIDAVLTGDSPNATLIVVVVYVLLNYVLLSYARDTWLRLVGASLAIERLLPDVTTSEELARWVNKRLNLLVQALVSVVAGAGGAVLAVEIIRVLGAAARHSPGYVVSISMTAALGCNAFWWLWQAPYLIARVVRFPVLKLSWVSPLSTPGVKQARELLLLASRRATVGMLLFAGPIVGTTLAAPDSALLLTVSAAALALSLLTVVFLLIAPQWWLIMRVRRDKERVLARIATQIPEQIPDRNHPVSASLLRSVHMYRLVEAAPVVRWDLKFLVSAFLMFAAAALPAIPLITSVT